MHIGLAEAVAPMVDVRSWGDRKRSVVGRTDAIGPYVWSGRALQEVFVELA